MSCAWKATGSAQRLQAIATAPQGARSFLGREQNKEEV